MIDLNSANVYFSVDTHVLANDWTRYSETQRTAAIAQAKREIQACTGIAIDETTTTDEDFPRWDCAVYEQAFFILRNTAGVLPQIGTPVPKELFPDADGDGKTDVHSGGICRTAMRFLIRGRASIIVTR